MNNLAEGTWRTDDFHFPKKIKQPQEYNEYERFLDKNIPLAEEGMKSFEFGICPGTIQHVLHNKGYRLFGVDNCGSAKELETHMLQLGFNVGEFLDQKYEDLLNCYRNAYDLVISTGFVEHFTNFEEVIRHHVALLKTGGTLWIGAPNFAYGLQYWLHKKYDKNNLARHYIPGMAPERWAEVIGEFDDMRVLAQGFSDISEVWFEDECPSRFDRKIRKRMARLNEKLGKIFRGSRYFASHCYVVAKKER